MAACGISTLFTKCAGEGKDQKGLVVIDAGHGGKDPGAMQGEQYEKDINLAVAKRLKEKLTKLGYQVKLTREADEFIELSERCDISNAQDVCFFVSLHCNICEGSSNVSGLETYYYTEGSVGREYADQLISYLSENSDLNIKAAKQGDLYVLRNTKAPAVLVELGYLSNASECELLSSSSYQKKMGAFLGDAIDQMIGQGM